MSRSSLLLSAALLSAPTFAWSQVQVTPPTSSIGAKGSGPVAVQEIVVTAQRRSESIQKVPLNVTAISGAALGRSGTRDVDALVNLVPGLQISAQDSFPLITIRGVGSVSADAYADPAVAFNVDGVYEGKGTSPNSIFYDVDRIEVLKGPQGTLYGRNATGGAINVITQVPQHDYEASASADGGNYGLFRADAMVNIPLNDQFALRVSGQYLRHDGYLSSGYNDADDGAVRARLLWDPNTKLRVVLSADYSHQGGKGGSDVYFPYVDNNNRWNQPESLSGNINTSQGVIPVSLLNYQYGGGAVGSIPYYPRDGYTDNQNYGVSATIDYDLDWAKLTIIPAYRKTLTNSMTPVTGLITGLHFDDRQATFEARLASEAGGPLKWILGAYYLNEDDPSTSIYQNSTFAELDVPFVGTVAQFLPINVAQNYNFVKNVVPDLKSDSAAAFGEATYTVKPGVRLTAGLRFTHDHKEQHGYSFDYDHFGSFPIIDNGTTAPALEPAPLSYALDTSKSWNALTYKLGADADIGPNSLVYASFSTGYKSGGIYQNRPGSDTYKPENLYAYTVGSKNKFFDGRVVLNAEAFYWIYRDHQLSAFIGDTLIPGAVVYATINAPRSTVAGADVEADWQVTRDDLLTASLEYLSTEFTDFTLPAGPPPAPTAPIDYSGKSLPYTPHYNVITSYQHTFRLGDAKIVAAEDGRFVTSQQENFQAELPEDRFHGYAKLNASLDYQAPGGRWHLMGWVRNLTNVAVINYVNNVGQLPFFAGIEPPRTYGATVGARF